MSEEKKEQQQADNGGSERKKQPIELLLEDAEVLVGYAVRNNIPNINLEIDGIVEAREAFTEGKLQGDAQRQFYVDLANLSAKVAPVTVTTLRSCLPEHGWPRRPWFSGKEVPCSHAERAGRFYRWFAGIVLLLLVAVQSYWLVGSNLLAAVPKLTDAARARLSAADAAALSPAAHTSPPQATDAAELALAEEARRNKQQISSMLAEWSTAIGWTPKTIREMAVEFIGSTAPQAAMPLTGEEIAARQTAITNALTDPKVRQHLSDLHSDRIIMHASRIVEVLQQYVLPLLYGCLGAAAYVLRTIGQQARARLFSADNRTDFNLRICLGIVAGLAIGWFFRGGTDGGTDVATVGSISAPALAFVAGYSVDLLFTAMDRIVSAFSTTPPPSAPVVPPPPAAGAGAPRPA